MQIVRRKQPAVAVQLMHWIDSLRRRQRELRNDFQVSSRVTVSRGMKTHCYSGKPRFRLALILKLDSAENSKARIH
jgi:hypothetical protein